MKSEKENFNKSKYSYLIQNTALLTLSSFGSKFLSFFLVPLYTNVLSTAEYGIADIITTSSTLLVYVLTLNIGASVLRFGIDKNEKPTRVFMYGAKIDIIACIHNRLMNYIVMYRKKILYSMQNGRIVM